MKTVARLLLPISWLYGSILWLRNFFFDHGVLVNVKSPVPTIIIGNLELGGTGKTPATDYVLKFLLKRNNVGLLSRGYGRKTTGFRPVTLHDNALQCGDEPLMLKRRNPTATIAVCESRLEGIEKMLRIEPDLNMVVADDALQHRRLVGKLNILCTLWDKPFFENQIFPSGTLRDHPVRARAAHIILVNKCPSELTEAQMAEFRKRIPEPLKKKKLVFSHLKYAPVKNDMGVGIDLTGKNLVLLTGIARPEYLVRHIEETYGPIAHHLRFPDHHRFSVTDLKQIRKNVTKDTVVLTTEKDKVRLEPFLEKELKGIPIYQVIIELGFHADGQSIVDNCLSEAF